LAVDRVKDQDKVNMACWQTILVARRNTERDLAAKYTHS